MEKVLTELCNPKQWKTISSDMLTEKGYPVYGANGIIGYFDKYNHEKETLLITCRGATCGNLNICKPYSYVNGNAMALDDLSDEIDLNYLFFFLMNRGLSDIITGSAQPQIIRNSLKNIKIIYPDINTQKNISQILVKIDTLISLRKKQIEKLDILIKSQFIEMFGDPVTNTQNRLIKPFIEFMDGIRYGTSQPPEFSDDGKYKFVRATNIKSGHITEVGMLRISQEEADKIEKCKLCGNEIIIVRSGVNTGDTCVVTEEYRDQYAGYDIIIKLNQKEANPIFFNELLNTHYMQLVVKPLTARSAQPHINAKQVSNLPMLVIPINEQNKFADFVKQTDKSKFEIQKSLEKLETLKKALMQEYFG